MSTSSLPVVIIGAGPVGLAAAAHTFARGLTPLVLEAGPRVGEGVRRWGHVRMFSPWKFAVDSAAAALCSSRQGWTMPPADEYPTGNGSGRAVPRAARGDARARAAHPPQRARRRRGPARPRSHEGRRPLGRRLRRSRRGPRRRRGHPGAGRHRRLGNHREAGRARRLRPAGLGEHAAAPFIRYGIPDVLGAERSRYAGRRVLVVGSGHSALNALLDLARLADDAPDTQ